MTRHEWTKTRDAFRRIAAREGIRKIAPAVPTHPATIYRIIRGDTTEPHQATKAGIERVVESYREDRKP